MKAKSTNLRQRNGPGNDDLSSNRDSSTATLKQWRQRLGFYSILAALPAMLVSDIQKARAEEATEPEVSVAGRGARLLERLHETAKQVSPASSEGQLQHVGRPWRKR